MSSPQSQQVFSPQSPKMSSPSSPKTSSPPSLPPTNEDWDLILPVPTTVESLPMSPPRSMGEQLFEIPETVKSVLEQCHDNIDCLRFAVPLLQKRLKEFRETRESNGVKMLKCVEGNAKLKAELEAEFEEHRKLAESKTKVLRKLVAAEVKIELLKNKKEFLQNEIAYYDEEVRQCNEKNAKLEEDLSQKRKGFLGKIFRK